MTSIPASRRARAMIFAPRSWPSRPGLATTTRILRVCVLFTAARKLPHAQPQVHARMDGAGDAVGAALAQALAVRALGLGLRRELRRAAEDRDVVRMLAGPDEADGGPAADGR